MSKYLNIKTYLITCLILVLIIFYLATTKKDEPCNCDCQEYSQANNSQTEEENVKDEIIYVDIKGAVKKPGVYEVKSNSIVNNAIIQAGGFTNNAYKNNLNLSKKVVDEMVIYVFTKYEFSKLNVKNDSSICDTSLDKINDCINSGNSLITTNKSSDSNTTENTKVNINTADQNTLMTLSGIGESKAKNIISYRLEHGNFKDITEIKNVTGIGDALYEQIKNNITI
jgi:competence protein ComEA